MADVQEIMNKMENLDKEVATTTKNDQELASLVTAAPTLAPSTCDQKNNRTVNLCCTTVLPSNLGHVELGLQTKLIYSVNCLTTAIEQCTVSVCDDPTLTVPVYKVKVVGCIPFAFSATDAFQKTIPINGKCGNYPGTPNGDPAPKKVDICCHGSVCVNNAICCQVTQDKALDVAKKVNDILDCTHVIISSGPTYNFLNCTCPEGDTPNCTFCADEIYVQFTATLSLPSCPA